MLGRTGQDQASSEGGWFLKFCWESLVLSRQVMKRFYALS